MFTIGTTPKTIIKIAEDHSVNLGAVSQTVLERGAFVKLATTGLVQPIVAVTEKPFGMVVAGNREAGEEVTVQTEFNAVVRGVADAAITIGDNVSVKAIAIGTEKLTQYKKSVTTNYVVGVALSDAADGESVMVGVYRRSILI